MAAHAGDDKHSIAVSEVLEKARTAFRANRTRSIAFRKSQLLALLRLYDENNDVILDALYSDLHRGQQEGILLEIEVLRNDIRNILYNFKDWAKPEYPSKSLVNILDSVYIIREPYGVVLIIGPWNYPFQLALAPLASAIAAGNCAVLKPSELAPSSSKVIADLVPKYLDNECYHVVEGGPDVASGLLKHRFDYIFFTGSSHIAKLVHAAATQYLTPTILELGGKSPVYMDDTVDMEVAARRILWGKWLNAGQTCIAPDFLICSKAVQDKFVRCAKIILDEWYGHGDGAQSPDFCRMINERHFQRVVNYLKDGRIVYGGKTDAENKFIQLTILVDVKRSSPVMQEEIFGPVLPICNIENVHEAIDFINEREKPLALYIFSNNKKEVELMLQSTSSGANCINDTVMHFPVDALPFGGVGMSGMGKYHGKYGFDTFSHQKGCLYKNLGVLGEKIACSRYPPYSQGKVSFLMMLLKKRRSLNVPFLSHAAVFLLGVFAVFFYKFVSNYTM